MPGGLRPELIFVDDGSTDRSLEMIKKMAEHSPEVRLISFSRNFGKEAAIYAGLEAATGDYAAVMDVDLQDPPSLLPDMLKAIEKEGYDCAGRAASPGREPLLRSFFARAFYKTIHQISDTASWTEPGLQADDPSRTGSPAFLKEYNRFSKGLYEWVGFGPNGLNMKMWNGWQEKPSGLSSSCSCTPLRYRGLFHRLWRWPPSWVLLSFISFLSIIILTVRELIWPHSAYGWTSLVCVFCLMGGIILLCLGILGQYLAKTYTEVKRRPIYIARERS
ncbi:MAG: glycosyltransferase family 2 protein [Akkermansia sp.]